MNLASTLHAKFLQSGDRNYVDESILLSRQCLNLAPSPSPSRFIPLNHLATNLLERFTMSGEQKDLDEAIIFGQEAITLVLPSHPHRVEALTHLSSALRARFEALGQYADLEDATAYLREVLNLTPGPTHRLYAITLHNLSNALTRRFQHSNNIEDLEEAIDLRREALTCSSGSPAERPDALSHLAHTLHIRFQRLGNRDNLDEAILLHKEALSLSSTQHPHYFIFVNLLGATLLSRAERFGKLLREEEAFHDMDEIISLLREAIVICPYSKQLVPLRSNLANALILKFQDYSGDLDDWEEGFYILKQLTDDAMLMARPSLSILSENLGNALLQRRKNYQSIANLVVGVNNFAKKYQIDVELTKKLSRLRLDLTEVASQYPSISSIAENLGTKAMVRRPDHEFEQMDDAMAAFEVAASSNSSSIISRFRAAVTWSQHAAASNHKSALNAYRTAINFVPMLASLGHDLLKRQEVLTQTGYNELVRDAAICAIGSGKYDTAIELLEAGRAVIWMQMLQLRTPMDHLRAVSPTLETRLAEISAELERGSHRAVDQNIHGNQEKMVSEKEASYFIRLNKQWVETIAEIRQLDGLEDFLEPRKLTLLQAAASKGPVILLIAGTSESDALIMTSNSVLHLKLPNINTHTARKMTLALREGVHQGARSNASPTPEGESSTSRYGHKFGHQNAESPIGNILKALWETVVEPIVRKLDLVKSESSLTIRWCPTGIFSFLPFHAAGVYRSDMSSVDSISEYAISSYTPTIGALLRHPRTTPSNTFKMLVAIESKSLPYTVHELNKIEMRVASECLVKLGVPGSTASIKTVLSHLSSVSIAHFACHAQQDSANPLDSALILEQEDLKISQIMQQPMPNASLAFLCACETAMGDENLPDENLHLGATLLYSGFRTVIATMWAINDEDGPTVSDTFYAELFQHDPACPDMTQTARAIHVATAKLRSQSVSFNRWVPFIHIGD
ncbi:CHAT domain-containing protein [Crucibulum laeve]|uniref:CHAT domain-containing protein n=1 Tax=Crucibulum laeve TaxID=68775 RepID=A0A5C3LI27_9AGAR|nr:CHAT domain-containing protein [Crucibulum laeve]